MITPFLALSKVIILIFNSWSHRRHIQNPSIRSAHHICWGAVENKAHFDQVNLYRSVLLILDHRQFPQAASGIPVHTRNQTGLENKDYRMAFWHGQLLPKKRRYSTMDNIENCIGWRYWLLRSRKICIVNPYLAVIGSNRLIKKVKN